MENANGKLCLIPCLLRTFILCLLEIEEQTLHRIIFMEALVSLQRGISVSLTMIEEFSKFFITLWLLKKTVRVKYVNM